MDKIDRLEELIKLIDQHSYNYYTLDLPSDLFADCTVKPINQEEWMKFSKLKNSPFKPLFTDNGKLYIYFIESRYD